jgi:hypothetical protein
MPTTLVTDRDRGSIGDLVTLDQQAPPRLAEASAQAPGRIAGIACVSVRRPCSGPRQALGSHCRWSTTRHRGVKTGRVGSGGVTSERSLLLGRIRYSRHFGRFIAYTFAEGGLNGLEEEKREVPES